MTGNWTRAAGETSRRLAVAALVIPGVPQPYWWSHILVVESSVAVAEVVPGVALKIYWSMTGGAGAKIGVHDAVVGGARRP